MNNTTQKGYYLDISDGNGRNKRYILTISCINPNKSNSPNKSNNPNNPIYSQLGKHYKKKQKVGQKTPQKKLPPVETPYKVPGRIQLVPENIPSKIPEKQLLSEILPEKQLLLSEILPSKIPEKKLLSEEISSNLQPRVPQLIPENLHEKTPEKISENIGDRQRHEKRKRKRGRPKNTERTNNPNALRHPKPQKIRIAVRRSERLRKNNTRPYTDYTDLNMKPIYIGSGLACYLKDVTTPCEELGSICSICINEVYAECDPGITLRCGHSFHSPCVYAWLNINPTCPYCRKRIINQ